MFRYFSLFLLLIFISCLAKKKLYFQTEKIEKIRVINGFPGTEVLLKKGSTNSFIKALNQARNNGPTKVMKTHKILIHHKNGRIDTISSNGVIHQFNGYFKSKENLIDQFKVDPTTIIQAQLKVAEKLKSFMEAKDYDAAIALFSSKQQENINEIKKDPLIFNYWCRAWTFDDRKYKHYIAKIKAGKGQFIFEEEEWKIDER